MNILQHNVLQCSLSSTVFSWRISLCSFKCASLFVNAVLDVMRDTGAAETSIRHWLIRYQNCERLGQCKQTKMNDHSQSASTTNERPFMDPSSSTASSTNICCYFSAHIIDIITGSEITGIKCLEVKYQLYTISRNSQRLFIWSISSDLLCTPCFSGSAQSQKAVVAGFHWYANYFCSPSLTL